MSQQEHHRNHAQHQIAVNTHQHCHHKNQCIAAAAGHNLTGSVVAHCHMAAAAHNYAEDLQTHKLIVLVVVVHESIPVELEQAEYSQFERSAAAGIARKLAE